MKTVEELKNVEFVRSHSIFHYSSHISGSKQLDHAQNERRYVTRNYMGYIVGRNRQQGLVNHCAPFTVFEKCQKFRKIFRRPLLVSKGTSY